MIFLLVGFSFLANFMFSPGTEGSPRISDFVCVLLSIGLCVRFSSISLSRSMVAWLWLINLYFGVWAVIGYADGDYSAAIASVRLLLGITAGFYLSLKILEEPSLWRIFSVGVVAGGVLITVIALGQFFLEGSIFDSVIPARSDRWWGPSGIRVVGIWEHPNGLAHSQMIAAAFALILVATKSMPVLGCFCFLFITLGIYTGTETRAGLVIAAILVGLFFLLVRSLHYRVVAVAASGLVVLCTAFYLGDAVERRWLESTANGMTLADNASERMKSTLKTMDLALSRPFGWGVIDRKNILSKHLRSQASHNSFLSFGMTFGFFPLVLIVAIPLWLLYRLIILPEEKFFMVFPLAGIALSFLFEDFIYSPTVLSLFPFLLLLGSFLVQPTLVGGLSFVGKVENRSRRGRSGRATSALYGPAEASDEN